MKLRNDYNALVIAGGWNINIFNPKWVSKFLLTEEEKLGFELPFNNVAGFPQVSSYRISSKKIRILAQNNRGNPDVLNQEQKETIDAVLEYYGDKSSQWLTALTHMEDPWRIARRGMSGMERGNRVIKLDTMAEYYSSIPIED